MKQRIMTLMSRFNSKSKKAAIAMLAVVLSLVMLVATFAWYYKQLSLGGSTFETGTIDFVATGFWYRNGVCGGCFGDGVCLGN